MHLSARSIRFCRCLAFWSACRRLAWVLVLGDCWGRPRRVVARGLASRSSALIACLGQRTKRARHLRRLDADLDVSRIRCLGPFGGSSRARCPLLPAGPPRSRRHLRCRALARGDGLLPVSAVAPGESCGTWPRLDPRSCRAASSLNLAPPRARSSAPTGNARARPPSSSVHHHRLLQRNAPSPRRGTPPVASNPGRWPPQLRARARAWRLASAATCGS